MMWILVKGDALRKSSSETEQKFADAKSWRLKQSTHTYWKRSFSGFKNKFALGETLREAHFLEIWLNSR